MKVKSLLKAAFCALLAVGIFYGCEKINAESLFVGTTEITLSGNRISYFIQFNASADWTADGGASWCSISPTSGTSDERYVVVSCEENTTSSPRTCYVTISVRGNSSTVKITQKAQ